MASLCTWSAAARPAASQRRCFRSAGSSSVPAPRPAAAPLRRRAVVAAAAAADTPSAAPSVDELRAELAAAIKVEDYATAARLRDQIAELEAADPVAQAEAALAKAVAEQRFEDAAALRDRLRELRPPPPPPPPGPTPPPYDPSATTASECITDGVRVTCRSFYVPSESRPSSDAFFFGYQISITNESEHTVKLVERYWSITNGRGQRQEVRGPGVVGEQPELAPGESFSYQSACPLPTPRGTMEGHYEMYQKDAVSGQWTKSFLAKIAEFQLRAD